MGMNGKDKDDIYEEQGLLSISLSHAKY